MSKKYTKEKLVTLFINKQLKKYNIDIEYVKQNQQIEGQPWYQYYTLTETEAKKIKDWFIDILKTKSTISKNRIKQEFNWLDLMYGLRVIKDNPDNIDVEENN